MQVEEQPTGSLSLGGAYSSSEGLTRADQPDRAQLPRPRPDGHAPRSPAATSSPTTSSASPSRRSSTATCWPGSTSTTADRNFDEQSFQTTNIGFEPRIGFPLSENGRLTLRYHICQGRHLQRAGQHLADHPRTSRATLITSAVGLTYAYDRRNSVVDPTAGFILTLNQEFAGLGGDTTYSKTQGSAQVYTSFFEEDLVLSAELEGGCIFAEDGTRITDRFSTGGDSFRGFARNGLGPRDFCDVPDECGCNGAPDDRGRRRGGGRQLLQRAAARRELPDRPARRSTASTAASSPTSARSGASTTPPAAWARSTTASTCAPSVGVSLFVDTPFAPLRFNYAVPDQEGGLRRASSASASPSRPGSEPRRAGGSALALAGGRWRSPARRRAAAPRRRPCRPAPAPQAPLAARGRAPSCFINQEQHPDRLEGRPGDSSPTRTASATRCAARRAPSIASFEEEESG